MISLLRDHCVQRAPLPGFSALVVSNLHILRWERPILALYTLLLQPCRVLCKQLHGAFSKRMCTAVSCESICIW
jgi:hypothetical protein